MMLGKRGLSKSKKTVTTLDKEGNREDDNLVKGLELLQGLTRKVNKTEDKQDQIMTELKGVKAENKKIRKVNALW